MRRSIARSVAVATPRATSNSAFIASSNAAASAASSRAGGTLNIAPSLKTNPSRQALYDDSAPAGCIPVTCAVSASARTRSGSSAGAVAHASSARRATSKHRACVDDAASSRVRHATPHRRSESTAASRLASFAADVTAHGCASSPFGSRAWGDSTAGLPPLAPIATTATPRRRGPGTAPEGVCVCEGLGTCSRDT